MEGQIKIGRIDQNQPDFLSWELGQAAMVQGLFREDCSSQINCEADLNDVIKSLNILPVNGSSTQEVLQDPEHSFLNQAHFEFKRDDGKAVSDEFYDDSVEIEVRPEWLQKELFDTQENSRHPTNEDQNLTYQKETKISKEFKSDADLGDLQKAKSQLKIELSEISSSGWVTKRWRNKICDSDEFKHTSVQSKPEHFGDSLQQFQDIILTSSGSKSTFTCGYPFCRRVKGEEESEI